MEDKPIHRLLSKFSCLQDSDICTLDNLLALSSPLATRPNTITIREGDRLEDIYVIDTGWAVRYKTLPDGRRQILNFLLPGDIFGLFGSLFTHSEFAVETLTSLEASTFSFAQMLEAFHESPRLALALTWLAGQDERQLDEQIIRIGRRDASERMAHLFMELHHRLIDAGLNGETARHFPLKQTVLADTLGMSHVHANRSFHTLARIGLVTLHNSGILLLDTRGLAELAGFDASYLEEVEVPGQTQRDFNRVSKSSSDHKLRPAVGPYKIP